MHTDKATWALANGKGEVHRTPGEACFNPNLEWNGLCELVSTDHLQNRSLIYIRCDVHKGLRLWDSFPFLSLKSRNIRSIKFWWFMFKIDSDSWLSVFCFLFGWENACVYKPWEDAGKQTFHEDFVDSGKEKDVPPCGWVAWNVVFLRCSMVEGYLPWSK